MRLDLLSHESKYLLLHYTLHLAPRAVNFGIAVWAVMKDVKWNRCLSLGVEEGPYLSIL